MNEQENDADQISDEELLYRRLYYTSLRRDGKIAFTAYIRRKPKPAIPDPEISVDLAAKTTPERTLAAVPSDRLDEFGLGVLKVGDVRALGFTVRYSPSRGNKAHCIIEGAKTETDCRRLAEITQVHTLPPGKPNR